MFGIDDLVQGLFGFEAAKGQMDAAKQALDQQQGQYAKTSANLTPYVSGGQQSLSQLLNELQNGGFQNNVNAKSLQNDPGYQFRIQQAQQALQRSASSKGMLGSGAFAKSLDQYSQGLASQEYQSAWARQQAQNDANFSRLYQTAGMGERAGTSLGQLGQENANAQSSLYGAYGNAYAGGIQAMGNGAVGFMRDGLSSVMGGGGGGGGGLSSMMGGGGGMNMMGGGGGLSYGPSGGYGFGGAGGMGGYGGTSGVQGFGMSSPEFGGDMGDFSGFAGGFS